MEQIHAHQKISQGVFAKKNTFSFSPPSPSSYHGKGGKGEANAQGERSAGWALGMVAVGRRGGMQAGAGERAGHRGRRGGGGKVAPPPGRGEGRERGPARTRK
jgi:hypothetical protein